MSTHKQHKIRDSVFGCYRHIYTSRSKTTIFRSRNTTYSSFLSYLKYLQYPQKPGKCLPHFPFDCSAIRGQGFTYTWHERCLPFTLALGNLPLTGAYHRRSTPYRIRCQQCDSPRQRQHILSVLGLYPTSKYPYNLLQQ